MADGAVSYHLDHFVQTRVSKLTYGSITVINYDSSNPEHLGRPTLICASGIKWIDKVFSVILSGVSYLLVLTSEKKTSRILTPFICKNKQVPETNEVRCSQYWEFSKVADLSSVSGSVYCYRGVDDDATYRFMDKNPGKTNEKEHHHHHLLIIPSFIQNSILNCVLSKWIYHTSGTHPMYTPCQNSPGWHHTPPPPLLCITQPPGAP